MPAATATADPPLEPAGDRLVSHGFLHGPHAFGSVNGTRPSSGVLVFPMIRAPEARTRAASSVSCFRGIPLRNVVPPEVG